MKKICFIALSFSQACLGITPYMRQKFQEIYGRNFPIEQIEKEAGLTVSDFLITVAALDSSDDIIKSKLEYIQVKKSTELTSHLTLREKNEYFETIKTLQKASSFKKPFRYNDSNNYQAPMYQQYEWAQIINNIESPNERLGALMYFKIMCRIQHPGEDIFFGEGKTMFIVNMLRQLRELPYYAGNVKNEAILGKNINFMVSALQYYLGFISINDTSLTDNLKMLCLSFMKIKPEDEDLDLNEYSNYVRSLTVPAWEKYEIQKTYSVKLLGALEHMHAAKIEIKNRKFEQQGIRPSSSESSDGLSSNSSFNITPRNHLLQALDLAILL